MCGREECEDEYIRDSGRTFVERSKGHKEASSPIHDHYNPTGHDISIDNFSILGREDPSKKPSSSELTTHP